MEEIKKVVTEYFEAQNWKSCYTEDKDAYNNCLYDDSKEQEEGQYKKYRVIKNIQSFCAAIKAGMIYVYTNGARFDNYVYASFDIEGNGAWKECPSPGYELRASFADRDKFMFIKKWNGNGTDSTTLFSINEIINKLLEIYNEYVLNNKYIVVVNRIVVDGKIKLQNAREFLHECKEMYTDKL